MAVFTARTKRYRAFIEVQHRLNARSKKKSPPGPPVMDDRIDSLSFGICATF